MSKCSNLARWFESPEQRKGLGTQLGTLNEVLRDIGIGIGIKGDAFNGAGYENRTRPSTLGRSRSATKLIPPTHSSKGSPIYCPDGSGDKPSHQGCTCSGY